ncbi:hypothetical protein [Lentilactobacillus hilgardii]|uniref:hypothetical protein n=1 Tax=Lentilactobacillus hilgardii TaxID=1588 RepID=UPI00019C630E|nr:hypothetical protein [Lentilactobacillus hilgardii]EEI19402.1 hypothetical protein HMPREF0497_1747 [Lentilactobacillus buchneri ATCC 11577]MCP9332528.1 hypothetical protein [Lentilactobacillus hilgardii]MCP9349135.1 hypothetical protein [Lentilactobacillus hilgardii]MCP9352003.1 hypothetical protein [Lentilactobacillus hilgardii]QIR10253.1 hypothetical protein G8J22_02261 [Lentilactobacillus hilgardii]
MAKKKFKMPKWIRDTLEAVIMIAVLMAARRFHTIGQQLKDQEAVKKHQQEVFQ